MKFSYQILYDAWKDTVTMTSEEPNRVKFRYYLEENLGMLLSELDAHAFYPSPLRNKTILYPKKRIAQVPALRDKIVQHAIYDNGVSDMLRTPIIEGVSACLVGRGDKYASDYLKKMLVRYKNHYGLDFYCLKCDIKSYFASIPHERVYALIDRYVPDKDFREIMRRFVDQSEVGLSLGLPQSQALANLFLSDLDHFCKEKLHAEFYQRHMDDFQIISNSVKYLEDCWNAIDQYVNSIGLTLNAKTCIYHNKVEFLGFRYFFSDSGKIIMRLLPQKRRSKRRELKKKLRMVREGKMTAEQLATSYGGWRAHALKGNCWSLVHAWDQWLIQEFASLGYKLRFHKRSVYLTCQEH